MARREEEIEFVVGEDEDGARIDRIVARHGEVSRRIARTWIATGRVRVRNKTVRILSRTLRAGARVVVEGRAVAEQPAPSSRLEILHLDRWMVGVNKPPGLLSEPDRSGSPSLESELPRLLKERGERRLELKLVHRLDAGTSGVMVVGRTPMGTKNLGGAFAKGKARKTYLALVAGRFEKATTVDAPLGRVEGTRQGVREDGKAARTRFEPLAVSDDASLVRARPTTGRTHQIRVHLAHLGHPIIGDRLYGGPGYTEATPPEPIPRAMLHAARLELPHPKTGDPFVLAAEPPADFEAEARRLGVWQTDDRGDPPSR